MQNEHHKYRKTLPKLISYGFEGWAVSHLCDPVLSTSSFGQLTHVFEITLNKSGHKIHSLPFQYGF